MRHLDEGMIHSWLDHALPAQAEREVEAHVLTCEECAAAVAEARGLIAASSRILATLDAVPAGVIPPAARNANGGGRGRRWVGSASRWLGSARARRVAAVAAFVAVGTAVGGRLLFTGKGRVAHGDGDARSVLANASEDTRHAPSTPVGAVPNTAAALDTFAVSSAPNVRTTGAATSDLMAARAPAAPAAAPRRATESAERDVPSRSRSVSSGAQLASVPQEKSVAPMVMADSLATVPSTALASVDDGSRRNGLAQYQRAAEAVDRSTTRAEGGAPDTTVVVRYLETKEALEHELMQDAISGGGGAATSLARSGTDSAQPSPRAAGSNVVPGMMMGRTETTRFRSDASSGMSADGAVERLRLVSSTFRLDGRTTIRVRLYQLTSGDYVTLMVTDVLPEGATVPLQTFTGRRLDVPNADALLDDRMIPGMHSVSWMGPLGTTYKLSGPFSTAELLEIRKLLPPPQLPQP
ncbi:MAG TPA: zf-HC2 domain-containing protein [Gemmatimonadaceae bacterium]|nr:zf-HC2 domain-containing protein [Gemmatimonadaceae bacterium]